MANLQVTGFIPVRVRGGGTVTYTRRRVLTNNTTAIFKYDAVIPISDGGWTVATGATSAAGSVAHGAVYTDTRGVRIEDEYLPAATLYTSSGNDPDNQSIVIIVADPLNVEFRASIDEAIVTTGLGINYKMVLGTGSTVTKLSGHELDATTPATTATFPWRVDGFVPRSTESDPDAADAHVICRMNVALSEPALSAGLGV